MCGTEVATQGQLNQVVSYRLSYRLTSVTADAPFSVHQGSGG